MILRMGRLHRRPFSLTIAFGKIHTCPHRPSRKIAPGQNLLIDADDTLWENNIYFERAIADFISFLNHHHYTPDEVRHVLYDVERENVRKHGYGMHSFAEALVICFEKLSVEPVTPELHQTIRTLPTRSPSIPWNFSPMYPRRSPTWHSGTASSWSPRATSPSSSAKSSARA